MNKTDGTMGLRVIKREAEGIVELVQAAITGYCEKHPAPYSELIQKSVWQILHDRSQWLGFYK